MTADKAIKLCIVEAVRGNTWQKFANPSAGAGKTAWPRTAAEQERFGLRFDYDTVVNKGGTEYHTFKMQANKGKIPSSIKAWRDKHGTHAVMATAWVKKDATMEEVKAALDAARLEFKNA
ncbi:hypothetical protein GSI_05685 [Ganoderma sinense ZZ0214-1]|uniref:Uncharacterized protein n=1 Tax=Ganoderma sinense ZZ0214-1 TaxID=1077348 RepID=A0A2G8SB84_9APHY|nr:hypothetical protein GSI_05685 [Ganoderma sinense ZZ0214-1]